MIHELKCWPEPFHKILSGAKRHEFRSVLDRSFSIGDVLALCEWKQGGEGGLGGYTGRIVEVKVTDMSRGPEWGIPVGFVVMSIDSLGEWETLPDLMVRLYKDHGISYSKATISDILTRCNPPGVEIRWTLNRDAGSRRRLELVRVSPDFINWIIPRWRQWRSKR